MIVDAALCWIGSICWYHTCSMEIVGVCLGAVLGFMH